MAVDKGYGSGYKNTGKSKKTATRRQMSSAEKSRAADLKSGKLGRPEGASPFNNLKGGAIKWSEIGSLAAGAALAGMGAAVSRVRSSNSPAATRARVIKSTSGALGGKPATYSNIKAAMKATRYSSSVTPDPWGGADPWPGVPRGLGPSAKEAAIASRRQAAAESTYPIAKTQPSVLKPSQRNAIDAGATLGARKSAVLGGIAYGYSGKPAKTTRRGR